MVTRSMLHAATRDGGRPSVTDAVTRSVLHTRDAGRPIVIYEVRHAT